jgi:hypothetical protein
MEIDFDTTVIFQSYRIRGNFPKLETFSILQTFPVLQGDLKILKTLSKLTWFPPI